MKPALRLTNPHSATTHYEPVADERAAVAYLDLGTGGYMDVGTDLTDEQLAALPKGRHMLAIIGTHGVNGYNPASAPVAGEAVTDEMIQAGAKAAREYFERTGGNDPAVIYSAMRAAAPAAPQASAEPVRIVFPAHLRKMWSGGEVQAWLDQHQGVTPPASDRQGQLGTLPAVEGRARPGRRPLHLPQR